MDSLAASREWVENLASKRRVELRFIDGALAVNPIICGHRFFDVFRDCIRFSHAVSEVLFPFREQTAKDSRSNYRSWPTAAQTGIRKIAQAPVPLYAAAV